MAWNFIAILGLVTSTMDTLKGMDVEARIEVRAKDGSNSFTAKSNGFDAAAPSAD